MNFIKSKKHNVNTIKVNKICLSCFGDKKYLLNGGISSYAHGHYKINGYEKLILLYEYKHSWWKIIKCSIL